MLRALISPVQVLQTEVPNVEFKYFIPYGEGSGFVFPSNYGSPHQRLGLWQDCAKASPASFDVCFFFLLTCLIYIEFSRLDFSFSFSEEIALYAAVDPYMSMGEDEFRIFLCHHLEPEFLI